MQRCSRGLCALASGTSACDRIADLGATQRHRAVLTRSGPHTGLSALVARGSVESDKRAKVVDFFSCCPKAIHRMGAVSVTEAHAAI